MATLIVATGAVQATAALRAHHLTPLLAAIGQSIASQGFEVNGQAVSTVRQNGGPETAARAIETAWVPAIVYGIGSGSEGTEVGGAMVETTHTLWLTAILPGVDGGIGATADQDAASLAESARYAVLSALGRTDNDSPTSAVGDVLPGGETQISNEAENGLFIHAVSLRIEALNRTPTLSNPNP